MELVRRAVKYLEKTNEFCGVATMSCMIVIVLAQVVSRYVLSSSIPWSEELARYLMVALVYLTAGVVLKRNGHISVTYFRDKMPPGLRKWVVCGTYLLVSAFSALISWEGFRLITLLMSQTSPAMGIPMGIAYASVPLGSFLLCLQSVSLLMDEFLNKER